MAPYRSLLTVLLTLVVSFLVLGCSVTIVDEPPAPVHESGDEFERISPAYILEGDSNCPEGGIETVKDNAIFCVTSSIAVVTATVNLGSINEFSYTDSLEPVTGYECPENWSNAVAPLRDANAQINGFVNVCSNQSENNCHVPWQLVFGRQVIAEGICDAIASPIPQG